MAIVVQADAIEATDSQGENELDESHDGCDDVEREMVVRLLSAFSERHGRRMKTFCRFAMDGILGYGRGRSQLGVGICTVYSLPSYGGVWRLFVVNHQECRAGDTHSTGEGAVVVEHW